VGFPKMFSFQLIGYVVWPLESDKVTRVSVEWFLDTFDCGLSKNAFPLERGQKILQK